MIRVRNIIKGISSYYRLFGCRGVMIAAKARILKSPQVFHVTVPNIKHPVYLRARTTDISTFAGILINREYELDLSITPKVIIDAGANIGMASIYYANEYPEAKIIAIEPARSNYELLTRNVAPYPNIIPVKAALWNANTDLNLIDPGMGDWGFQSVKDQSDNNRCEIVQGITMEKLISDHRLDWIDILKLDIEGAEKEVLENAVNWMSVVDVIAAELHDRFKKGCSEAFIKATNDFGYECVKGETIFRYRKKHTTNPQTKTHQLEPFI